MQIDTFLKRMQWPQGKLNVYIYSKQHLFMHIRFCSPHLCHSQMCRRKRGDLPQTTLIINSWKDGVHHVVCVWVTYEHNFWQSFMASCHQPVTLPRATVSTPQTILNTRMCVIAGLHVYQHRGSCKGTAISVRAQRRSDKYFLTISFGNLRNGDWKTTGRTDGKQNGKQTQESVWFHGQHSSHHLKIVTLYKM